MLPTNEGEAAWLADLPTEQAFWWISFWAGRGHTPYSVSNQASD